jgi:hypothetical protein
VWQHIVLMHVVSGAGRQMHQKRTTTSTVGPSSSGPCTLVSPTSSVTVTVCDMTGSLRCVDCVWCRVLTNGEDEGEGTRHTEQYQCSGAVVQWCSGAVVQLQCQADLRVQHCRITTIIRITKCTCWMFWACQDTNRSTCLLNASIWHYYCTGTIPSKTQLIVNVVIRYIYIILSQKPNFALCPETPIFWIVKQSLSFSSAVITNLKH